jgi:tRNA threonylcarbamoyladenosine modification (KEOPS) complex  Pcc1 subunit
MLERILYHDHCFDGAASAAFFSRFIAGAVHPDAEFRYTGMAHRASQAFDPALFDGDENAIVDFKYSSDPRLTWWFDHHQSAFLTAEDAEHFRRDTSGRKLYDPSYKSCTSFICTVAGERFGFHAPDLADLVRWSVVIDGAQYPDARTAVEMGEPAMKLTLVIEAAKESDIVRKIIGWMQVRQLSEIIVEPEIQALFEPLYRRHLDSIEIIGNRARQDSGVVFFDLAGYEMEGYNKFIPYYLFPSSTYTVSVSPSSFRTKISVGSNPWVPAAPKHNLATICERYGGGGHARVGAISLEPGALEKARSVAAEIVEELKS